MTCQKVVIEADSIMAMYKKMTGSVTAVQAAKNLIQDSSSLSGKGDGSDSEFLTSLLTKDAADIKMD